MHISGKMIGIGAVAVVGAFIVAKKMKESSESSSSQRAQSISSQMQVAMRTGDVDAQRRLIAASRQSGDSPAIAAMRRRA